MNPVNSEGTDLTRCISVGIITQRMYEAMGGEKLNLKGNESPFARFELRWIIP